MARSDGFPVMDVSTDILNDPKFRRVQRDQPDHVGNAVTGYIATIAESWKAGRRISVVDAWPVLVPYDETAVTAMRAVGLLDKAGQVPAKTWNGWFGPAKERREAARERWRRANEKRTNPSTSDSTKPARSNGGTSRTPRGHRAVAASSVPLRTVRSVPTESGGGAKPGSDRARPNGLSRIARTDFPDELQPLDELPTTPSTTPSGNRR